MWTRLLVGIGVYEVVISYLAQAELVSDGLMARILEQYPPLAVVLIVVYWLRRTQREDARETNDRLDKMLETQRISLKDIYESQHKCQERLVHKVEKLENQIAINTATVAEISQVDNIVSDLIARLEKK